MQLLCLGLGRTGTSSLERALEILGYNDIYNLESVTTARDVDLWMKAMDAKYKGKGPFGRKEWDQLLGHYSVVKSLPSTPFAAELVEAYPEAQVILTTRDTEGWYESYRKTVWWRFNDPVLLWLSRVDERSRYGLLLYRLLNHYYQGSFKDHGKRVYEEHNLLVRRLVPREKLLEYRVSEGWGPLCAFLGKKIPDAPFPRINDQLEYVLVCRIRDRERIYALIIKVVLTLTVVGIGAYILRSLYLKAFLI